MQYTVVKGEEKGKDRQFV